MSGTAGALDVPIRLTGSQQVEAELKRIAASGREALGATGAAASTAAQGMGRFTQTLQSGGYQMQDFAVQVQGGTNWMTALSQQGSQFLGSFGTGGAIAGAILTVGILAVKLLEGKDALEAINGAVKTTDEYFQRLEKASDGVTNSLAAQRDELVKLRNQYANLDAAQREYERRELDRRQRTNDEAAATLRGEATSTLAATSTAQIRRSVEGDASRFGLRAPPVLPEQKELLDLLAAMRAGGAVDPSRLSALGTQLERLSQGQGRTAEDAKEALAAIDKLLPKARELADAQSRINLAREALSGDQSILDTLPPVEPTDGPPEKRRQRAARLTAEQKAAKAELEEVTRIIADMGKARTEYEGILVERGREADSLVQSLDPAAAAAAKYEAAIKGIAEAVRLYKETVGTEGGALGISEERGFELQESAAKRYKEELERVGQAGEKSGQQMSAAFGRATSRLEDVITKGGKASDVFKALSEDIARLITQRFVTNPLEKAAGSVFGRVEDWVGSLFGPSVQFGGNPAAGGVSGSPNAMANGGIMSAAGRASLSSIPVHAYATGGIARSPQVALFGEGRMPEAYVPLPDGKSIPVNLQGRTGGGSVYAPSFSIDARGADVGVEARLRAALPGIVDAANAKMLAEINRGGAYARTTGRRS